MTANPAKPRGGLAKTAGRKARPGAGIPFTTEGEAEEDGRK